MADKALNFEQTDRAAEAIAKLLQHVIDHALADAPDFLTPEDHYNVTALALARVTRTLVNTGTVEDAERLEQLIGGLITIAAMRLVLKGN